ncbi:hypothetical protein GQ53DRAFT_876283 [Thozetella sp. PMI_491]|nr:hypothetical protein GQ53DRAFT_876283 [Thozetella sp. PMI_491]
MSLADINDLPHALVGVVLRLLSFSYSGAYAYHTVNPIDKIKNRQQYYGEIREPELIKALAHFRQNKSDELKFVSAAATLSGAAVIGVFSWPTTETTVWAAKMLWNWSLFMSTFSLISSAHQRLLRHLPEKDNLEYNGDKIRLALNLFLQPPVKPANLDTKMQPRRISKRMLWFWQCPMMLMHYSWVFFLVGYALHVLTPVFDPSQAETSSKVSQRSAYFNR